MEEEERKDEMLERGRNSVSPRKLDDKRRNGM